MKWIAVKDKLPFMFKKVLVWIEPPNLLLGYFDIGAVDSNHQWYVTTNKHTVQYVSHWLDVIKPD